jgi:endonuclease YncB( thermonuclease family)
MFVLRRLTIFCLGLLLLLSGTANARPSTITGLVVRVSDGDTIQVMHEGKAEKIRLSGIDCPESKQPFGQAAKKFVLEIAAQKTVTVYVETTDRYGRTVGEVILPDGRNLNKELVQAGYAWWYRKYSINAVLGQLESEARSARRGLWSDPHPVAPWDWRHNQKTSPTSKLSAAQPTPTTVHQCGTKRYCKQMTTCEEAMFYLRVCGLSTLDGNHDGVPCEALCSK